jgi:hypothetical protein
MINEMNKKMKWKSVYNKGERRNYRRLRSKLKRATDKARSILRPRNFKEQNVVIKCT